MILGSVALCAFCQGHFPRHKNPISAMKLQLSSPPRSSAFALIPLTPFCNSPPPVLATQCSWPAQLSQSRREKTDGRPRWGTSRASEKRLALLDSEGKNRHYFCDVRLDVEYGRERNAKDDSRVCSLHSNMRVVRLVRRRMVQGGAF